MSGERAVTNALVLTNRPTIIHRFVEYTDIRTQNLELLGQMGSFEAPFCPVLSFISAVYKFPIAADPFVNQPDIADLQDP
ncbi:hypothetical protein TNCV_4675011 [Trichonephila clavipes]|nr:hypothetical protein TNCV_4675011 [Trichonephila clavipes]